VFSGIFMAAGSLLLIGLSLQTSALLLLVAYFLRGAGVGLVNPPISTVAISGMPAAQAGVAGAIASTSRQIGFALGVAVVGAVSGAGATGRIGPSFAAATHAGWIVLSALGLIVVVLGWITTTKRALDSAERTARLFEEPAKG
jgi:MFS family permease